MSAGIARHLSPEEEELGKKREEVALLQADLADRELYLINLQAELVTLEGRYLRQVGILYAELDEWNAKIAELVAEDERTEDARSEAAQARAQADESRSTVGGGASKAKDFAPSAELKSMYREVAKRIHPDLATDDEDRRKRDRLMAEANRAYEQGDADAMRKVLEEYESSPESVKGTGAAADLVRVIRQIKQIRSRLAQIELEIARLLGSDIAKLRAKVEAARTQGRDLLAEMAEDVKSHIEVARRRFEVRSAGITIP